MSTLQGRRVSDVTLHVPSAGGWWADVTLDVGPVPEPGPAALVIGDLTLQGSVLGDRRGFDGPDLPSCVVAGGAGWRSLITRAGEYSSPAGVRLSTVLRDLAAAAGEAIEAPPERLLGTAYGWSAATSGAPRMLRGVLDELVSRGAVPTWRVDPNGATSFSAWPTLPPTETVGRIMRRRVTEGVRYVGLDTRVAAFLPGATIEGVPIRRVIYRDVAGALTAEVWS